MKVLYTEIPKREAFLEQENEQLQEKAKLTDVVFKALEKIPEFKSLSMDRQGEISISVVKLIGE